MSNHTNCAQCGGVLAKSVEDYHYTECGLDNIVLHDITIGRCDKCEIAMIELGDLDELHGNIAKRLLDKDGKLTFEEANFICDLAASRMEGFPFWGEEGEA